MTTVYIPLKWSHGLIKEKKIWIVKPSLEVEKLILLTEETLSPKLTTKS